VVSSEFSHLMEWVFNHGATADKNVIKNRKKVVFTIYLQSIGCVNGILVLFGWRVMLGFLGFDKQTKQSHGE